MATSSIFTSVKITDPKKAENFAEALDVSAHETERTFVQSDIPLVTNIEEIRKFMGMGSKENE